MAQQKKWPDDHPRVGHTGKSRGHLTTYIKADPNRSSKFLEPWEVDDLERKITGSTKSDNEIAWEIGCSSRNVQRHRKRIREGREPRESWGGDRSEQSSSSTG